MPIAQSDIALGRFKTRTFQCDHIRLSMGANPEPHSLELGFESCEGLSRIALSGKTNLVMFIDVVLSTISDFVGATVQRLFQWAGTVAFSISATLTPASFMPNRHPTEGDRLSHRQDL